MSSNAQADTAKSLSAAIAEVLKVDSVRAQFDAMGATPVAMSPEDFGSFLEKDSKNWQEVIQRRGITLK